MAFIPFSMAPAGAVETDRFRGYTTMVVTTWAVTCAQSQTPIFLRRIADKAAQTYESAGRTPSRMEQQFMWTFATQLAANWCACTIDHWRETMPYAQTTALDPEERSDKNKLFALMCDGKSEEL